MAVSAQERRFLLSQLSRLAQADLARLWAQAEALPTDEFARFVVEAYPQIAAPYVSAAGDLAASWFEESDPASSYVATSAAPDLTDRMQGTARWALGAAGTDALLRMDGPLQRAIFDGARETTLANVEATGSTWIRVARPEACAFCRMLSSRGEVYASELAARTVVGRRGRPRGSRKIGDKYHDDCYCQPVEVRLNQTLDDVLDEPTRRSIDQWNDEYEKARANAGSGDPKQILAAWRQIGPAVR